MQSFLSVGFTLQENKTPVVSLFTGVGGLDLAMSRCMPEKDQRDETIGCKLKSV